jgi:hypothetical protein
MPCIGRHTRIKQYLKDERALQFETVINDSYDLSCPRRLAHLDELQARARAVNAALLDTERIGQGCVLASPAFERIAQPTLTEDGSRAPALRFGALRVQALAGALCTTLSAVTGITNKRRRALMAGLLGGSGYTMNQASYDLGGLRDKGLITRIPGHNQYRLIRRRAAVRDLLHQTARPATASPGRRRSTASAATLTKGPAHHQHSHHRSHRPSATPTEHRLNTRDNSQSPSGQGSVATKVP